MPSATVLQGSPNRSIGMLYISFSNAKIVVNEFILLTCIAVIFMAVYGAFPSRPIQSAWVKVLDGVLWLIAW